MLAERYVIYIWH